MPKKDLLLISFEIDRPHHWGIRVTTGGLVEELNDKRMTYQDGRFIAIPCPLEWRQLTMLDASEAEELAQTIRSSDFFNLPPHMEDQDEMDSSRTTWQAALDGRLSSVSTLGGKPANHPTLQALSVKLQLLTAQAMRREHQKNKNNK